MDKNETALLYLLRGRSKMVDISGTDKHLSKFPLSCLGEGDKGGEVDKAPPTPQLRFLPGCAESLWNNLFLWQHSRRVAVGLPY